MAVVAGFDTKKLSNIKLTKEQQQYLVMGVVLVGGLIYGYFAYVLGPLNSDIKTLTKTRDDKANTLKQAKELDARREEYTQRLARVQAGTSYVARRLPPANQNGESISRMIKMMTEGGVQIASYQPDTTVNPVNEFSGLHKITVNLELYSDFQKFGDFLSRLSSEEIVYYIEDLHLDQLPAGTSTWATVKASMKLVSFVDIAVPK